MPRHVVELIISSLNEYKKPIKGSKILIVGVAYKKDINDCRESPALDIIQILNELGSDINYFDPYVPQINYGGLKYTGLADLNENIIPQFDATVIVTDHSNINYDSIDKHSKLIVDTRNVYGNSENKSNIVRLGESPTIH